MRYKQVVRDRRFVPKKSRPAGWPEPNQGAGVLWGRGFTAVVFA